MPVFLELPQYLVSGYFSQSMGAALPPNQQARTFGGREAEIISIHIIRLFRIKTITMIKIFFPASRTVHLTKPS